jgi:hypothetical protein
MREPMPDIFIGNGLLWEIKICLNIMKEGLMTYCGDDHVIFWADIFR